MNFILKSCWSETISPKFPIIIMNLEFENPLRSLMILRITFLRQAVFTSAASYKGYGILSYTDYKHKQIIKKGIYNTSCHIFRNCSVFLYYELMH